jgi:hypothetical protein
VVLDVTEQRMDVLVRVRKVDEQSLGNLALDALDASIRPCLSFWLSASVIFPSASVLTFTCKSSGISALVHVIFAGRSSIFFNKSS